MCDLITTTAQCYVGAWENILYVLTMAFMLGMSAGLVAGLVVNSLKARKG